MDDATPGTDADLRRYAVARAARHLRWPELCDAPSAVAAAELGAACLSGEALAAIADAARGDPRRRCWSDLYLDDGHGG